MRILRLHVMPCSVVVGIKILGGSFNETVLKLKNNGLLLVSEKDLVAKFTRNSKWYNFMSFTYGTFQMRCTLIGRNESIDVIMHFKSRMHSWLPKIDRKLVMNECDRLLNGKLA